ncbi:unnamed protein product, partial [Meganyctiphanes norvegica]
MAPHSTLSQLALLQFHPFEQLLGTTNKYLTNQISPGETRQNTKESIVDNFPLLNGTHNEIPHNVGNPTSIQGYKGNHNTFEKMADTKKIGQEDEKDLMCQEPANTRHTGHKHLLSFNSQMYDLMSTYNSGKDEQAGNKEYYSLLSVTGLGNSRMCQEWRPDMTKGQAKILDKYARIKSSNKIVDGYYRFMKYLNDSCILSKNNISADLSLEKIYKSLHKKIIRTYSEAMAETVGRIVGIAATRGRNTYPLTDHIVSNTEFFRKGDKIAKFGLQATTNCIIYTMSLNIYPTQPGGRLEHVYIYSCKSCCPEYYSQGHNTSTTIFPRKSSTAPKHRGSSAEGLGISSYLIKDIYPIIRKAVYLMESGQGKPDRTRIFLIKQPRVIQPIKKVNTTVQHKIQLCSLEITADSGAVIASTLANGGINPLTADPVLTTEAVRNTLTLMHSCGMYNYSGQFAFKVGLPSKSGVSGCVLLVIPNTMGICLWSPPLDTNGNSVRGVEFCMELVNRFTFHHFDNLRGHVTTKQDPRMAQAESRAQVLFDLLFSVAAGDLSALRRHSLSGSDMEASDYDGRTALHVAASEGHTEVVEFLLENCHVNPLPQDRWGRTPLDDAVYFEHPNCEEFIRNNLRKNGTDIPSEVSNNFKE